MGLDQLVFEKSKSAAVVPYYLDAEGLGCTLHYFVTYIVVIPLKAKGEW